MEAQARLSKDVRRFLCKPRDCGAELAKTLWSGPPESWAVIDSVFLPDGVVPRDGIYRLSERSEKRIRRGQTPGHRRAVRVQKDDRKGRRSHGVGGPLKLELGIKLPIRRQCPDCGLINTIKPVRRSGAPVPDFAQRS